MCSIQGVPAGPGDYAADANGTRISAPIVGAIMRENSVSVISTQTWKQLTVQDPQALPPVGNHVFDEQGKCDIT